MAKTESTAVNALIDQVKSNNRPLAVEPGSDLFASPAPQKRASSPMFGGAAAERATLQGTSPMPARMTGTVPTMKVAADVAPLPRTRAPASTAEHALPPPVRMGTAPQPRGTTIPPLAKRTGPVATTPPASAPVAAPFEVKGPSPFISPPAPPPRFAVHSQAALQVPPVESPKQAELPAPQLLFADAEHTMLGRLDDTARTRADNIALAKKLVIPGILCIAAGIAAGFYVTGNKSKAKNTKAETTQTAPTAKAAPTPNAPETETVRHPVARSIESQNSATSTAGGEQPEPPTKEEQAAQVAAVAAVEGSLTNDAPAAAVATVREVQTAKGVVAFKDVRIDTDPQGASITLVDGGKQFPLGSTPLSTSLDSSREYDVIIEMAGRPSQMVHLVPSATSRLDISLGKKSRAVAPASVAASVTDDVKLEKPEAKVAKPAAKVATTEVAKIEDAPKAKAAKAEVAKTEDAPKAKAAKAAVAKTETEKSDAKPAATINTPASESEQAAATTNGTLMISSKPPCEIHIDGSPTGLTTPQRSIEISPGKHKITFVNAEQNIKTSFNVMIKAGAPTKLIKDFLSK